ncbi:enoyl-CoA hydratase [Gordonia hankookensis]|uniref:Enoyl-CoA hydratase n=1 Tax=Gordonia hankookensis TaxID=589403 RepID=A0ABR7WCK7_9ACTN|nr:enoyl-CoA hydratase [Gordonia hankookensis]MBD1320528.1 enoyl-CoA hydratase [Gordonia hankookensis]
MRKNLALLLVAGIGALSWFGTGTVAAEPQLPKFSTTGDNFGTFGDHDFCRGAVNLGLTAPKGKHGVVRVTLTSFGFMGSGRGWARNPVCRVLMVATQTSGNSVLKQTPMPVAFGPRRGQKVTRDIVTGPGVALVSVIPYTTKLPRISQGNGAGAYVLVP